MNDYQLLRDKVDSDEEVYFIWWMEELYQAGYIEMYERSRTYQLSTPIKRDYLHKMKTKSVDRIQHVMHGAEYTPDFKIYWTPKALNVFITKFHTFDKKETIFYCEEDLTSIIEIKGMFDRNNMIRLVTTNIKWMFDKYRVFVHLVKMPKLFKDTFTPERYLKTNKSQSSRSIKWKIKTMEEYAASI